MKRHVLGLLLAASLWMPGALMAAEAAGGTAEAAPAPAPKAEPDSRVTITTQPGDSAGSEASLKYKGPKITFEGSQWELRIPGWYPEANLWQPRLITWGLWAGGRGSILLLPLDERLQPMVEDRNLRPFDNYLFMVGPRLDFDLEKSLRIGAYFDTGSQEVGGAGGGGKQGSINVTRLGIGFEALQPVSSLVNLAPADPAENIPMPFNIANVGFGLGLDMGVGNINLAFQGDNLKNWTHNEPFIYMAPLAIVSVPLTAWSRVELYGGYQFVSMNNFSVQSYLNLDESIKGSDFNGWIGGVQLLFGSGALNELGRKNNKDGGG